MGDLLNSIHWMAVFIGYFFMLGGGIVLAICMAFIVYERVIRFWRRSMNMLDLQEAFNEWKERHPEKAEKARGRNG